jgi:hypothetical protein
MAGRLRWLLGIGAVLALGYGAMLLVWPDARPTFPRGTRRTDGRPPAKASWTEQTLTVRIPAGTEGSEGSDRTGCPMSAVSAILGVAIASPHGCYLGHTTPGGPADAAGLKAGDSIIACQGESVHCPSSLLRHVLPTEDDHDVELTVRRRQRAEAAEDEEG